MGQKVAGFTTTLPMIPRDTMQKYKDEIGEKERMQASQLKRPIALIPASVHNDPSYIVPGLLQQQ